MLYKTFTVFRAVCLHPSNTTTHQTAFARSISKQVQLRKLLMRIIFHHRSVHSLLTTAWPALYSQSSHKHACAVNKKPPPEKDLQRHSKHGVWHSKRVLSAGWGQRTQITDRGAQLLQINQMWPHRAKNKWCDLNQRLSEKEKYKRLEGHHKLLSATVYKS